MIIALNVDDPGREGGHLPCDLLHTRVQKTSSRVLFGHSMVADVFTNQKKVPLFHTNHT